MKQTNSILIFGTGWLGKKLGEYCNAELSGADITDSASVCAALDATRPSVVINAAGKTGRPNIDWCENHKEETVHSNITGPFILLNACKERGIRLVHFSSGCIFDGASPAKNGFTEKDTPNPISFYAWTKAQADAVLSRFPTLIIRLRMPIDSMPHERNLITKLANYSHIIDAFK